jgi:hypothetical protein
VAVVTRVAVVAGCDLQLPVACIACLAWHGCMMRGCMHCAGPVLSLALLAWPGAAGRVPHAGMLRKERHMLGISAMGNAREAECHRAGRKRTSARVGLGSLVTLWQLRRQSRQRACTCANTHACTRADTGTSGNCYTCSSLGERHRRTSGAQHS